MRSFKVKAALFSLVGLAAMLVAACGSTPAGTTTTTTPSAGYNFSYAAQTPKTKGGTVVFGDWQFPDTLNPLLAGLVVDLEVNAGLFDGCVVQVPDLSLGIKGFFPDQCTEVPTVANGDESADGTSTTMKLDPNAVWSDGTPITASDYLFYYALASDPNVGGDASPISLMKTVTEVDSHTIKITWTAAYAPYLTALLIPLPLHTFNTGKYAGIYKDSTGDFNPANYSTTLAQGLSNEDSFNQMVTSAGVSTPTNGPFTVQSFAANDSIVLASNPKFHSNYFKGPFLDKAIFKTTGDKNVLIQAFKAGQYDHVENFTIGDIAKFAGIDPSQIITSSAIAYEHLEFNQRPQALNAVANPAKTSIFAGANGLNVRKAFIEAFDRCSALKATLGITNCNDPNILTNEVTAPPSLDYSANVPFPSYNAVDAAALMDAAGYKTDKNGFRTYPNSTTEITITLVSTKGNNVRDAFLALLSEQYQNNLNIHAPIVTYKAGKLFTTFDQGGILATGQYDVSLFAFSSGSDPDGLTSIVQTNQVPTTTNVGGSNFAGVADPNVDAQLASGRQTLDYASRQTIYQALQKYITSQYYFEPLYIRADITLTKSTLGNYKQNPTSAGNEWNMADWYTTA